MISRRTRAGREQSEARLLSTGGALIAGVGAGLLFPDVSYFIGAFVLVAGIAAHLVGMMANHKLEQAAGYVQAPLERIAYWLCWVAIGAALIALVMVVM